MLNKYKVKLTGIYEGKKETVSVTVNANNLSEALGKIREGKTKTGRVNAKNKTVDKSLITDGGYTIDLAFLDGKATNKEHHLDSRITFPEVEGWRI